MKKLLILITFAAVVLLLATAGCVGDSGNQNTPAPTQTVSPTQTPSDFSLKVGQLDSFPLPQSLYEVRLNINRNSVTPEIDVEFSGGAGTDRIETIDVTLYRADDQKVITQTFVEPKQRDILKFTGSSTPFVEDRIKATAHYTTGETVVFSDDLYKFKSA